MAVETKTMTAEDLLRMSDDGFLYELVDGEIRKILGASLSTYVR